MKRSITDVCLLSLVLFIVVAVGLVYMSTFKELQPLLFLVLFLLAIQVVAIISLSLFMWFAPIDEDDKTKN